MSIIFKNNTFYLSSDNTSYVIGIENGKLITYYWGKRIPEENIEYYTKNLYATWAFNKDLTPQEFPEYATGDYKNPVIEIELPDGSSVTDFRYKTHSIMKGKPDLPQLPHTYCNEDADADSLDIYLQDAVYDITAVIHYSVFKCGAITKSVTLYNGLETGIRINRIASASFDMFNDNYQIVSLHGAWSRERHVYKHQLQKGIYSFGSNRGTSSHNVNPFFALASQNADENYGEVYAFNMVYSGNFEAAVELNPWNVIRAQIGMNPFEFSWKLEKGESFNTPETVMVFSADGFNGMSGIYHSLYRNNLCRGKYKLSPRPILINNWEATYFDFDENKLMKIAEKAKSIGIELFVLDDGWFGKRNDDKSSLGDWWVNSEKLPSGLDGISSKLNSIGLKFGLWIEPEMISPDSELYEKHPDWCLHVPQRERSQQRSQLVLDLSRREICDYITDAVSRILESANISYIKWDMNRYMTEVYSISLPKDRQKEVSHRYVLGLYSIMERLTSRFPDVLFEGCSGGGGRFDPGMLYYMPQIWTSDDTDAYERMYIQYGTSMVYPISTMGCHVSAVPNHQTGRTTPLKTRGEVSMSGNFGYELDLSKCSEDELKEMRRQIEFYKENRTLIQFGRYYRIMSPFESNYAIWQFVSEDKKETLVFAFKKLNETNKTAIRFRLLGLDGKYKYKMVQNGMVLSGEVLMNVGVVFPDNMGDYQSFVMKFVAEN